MRRLCFETKIVIFATIAVSRAPERAKKIEEERDKGILGLGGASRTRSSERGSAGGAPPLTGNPPE